MIFFLKMMSLKISSVFFMFFVDVPVEGKLLEILENAGVILFTEVDSFLWDQPQINVFVFSVLRNFLPFFVTFALRSAFHYIFCSSLWSFMDKIVFYAWMPIYKSSEPAFRCLEFFASKQLFCFFSHRKSGDIFPFLAFQTNPSTDFFLQFFW